MKVYLYNATTTTVLHQVVLDPGNPATYDKTTVAVGGATWYRVPVFASTGITVGNSIRFYVTSSSGAATFRVDGAYVQEGVTTAPAAWSKSPTCTTRTRVIEQIRLQRLIAKRRQLSIQ